MLKTLSRLWWKYIVPRPVVTQPGGMKKLIEWCAKGRQDDIIETIGHVDNKED